MTPHISAGKGEIADFVLIFGCPIRCKTAADKYLTNPKLVSSIRGALFITGTHNGREVTFGTSGMGPGSMGIYAYELFQFYGVNRMIRVGTAGAYSKKLSVGDYVIVSESVPDDTTYSYITCGERWETLSPDPELKADIQKMAEQCHIKMTEHRTHSSAVYYLHDPLEKLIEDTKCDCVEMETYALFTNARRTGKKAAAVLAIVDEVYSQDEISSDERVVSCNELIELSLRLA